MRFSVLASAALVTLLAGCGPGPDASQKPKAAKPAIPMPALIPAVREFTEGQGLFKIDATTEVIWSGGAGAADAARFFNDQVKLNPELTFREPREDDSASNAVSFELKPEDSSFEPEGYALSVTPGGVHVTARTPAGLLHGGVTLWQLITLRAPQGGVAGIPAIEIHDAPR